METVKSELLKRDRFGYDLERRRTINGDIEEAHRTRYGCGSTSYDNIDESGIHTAMDESEEQRPWYINRVEQEQPDNIVNLYRRGMR